MIDLNEFTNDELIERNNNGYNMPHIPQYSPCDYSEYATKSEPSDTGEISGQALNEAVPTSPFATDKHFCEIGHVLETRTGAGLAKVNLHFN